MEFNLTLSYTAGLDTCICFNNKFLKMWNHLSSLQAQFMVPFKQQSRNKQDRLVLVKKEQSLIMNSDPMIIRQFYRMLIPAAGMKRLAKYPARSRSGGTHC